MQGEAYWLALQWAHFTTTDVPFPGKKHPFISHSQQQYLMGNRCPSLVLLWPTPCMSPQLGMRDRTGDRVRTPRLERGLEGGPLPRLQGQGHHPSSAVPTGPEQGWGLRGTAGTAASPGAWHGTRVRPLPPAQTPGFGVGPPRGGSLRGALPAFPPTSTRNPPFPPKKLGGEITRASRQGPE